MSPKKCIIYGLVLGLVFAATAWAKPMTPLSLELQAGQPPRAGEILDLVVRVRSHLDSDELELRVSLPPAAQLLAGEREQVLRVQAHRWQAVKLRIRLPDPLQGHIDAVARIRQGGETRYAAGARLALQPSRGKQRMAPPEVRRQRDGQGIREFVLP